MLPRPEHNSKELSMQEKLSTIQMLSYAHGCKNEGKRKVVTSSELVILVFASSPEASLSGPTVLTSSDLNASGNLTTATRFVAELAETA